MILFNLVMRCGPEGARQDSEDTCGPRIPYRRQRAVPPGEHGRRDAIHLGVIDDDLTPAIAQLGYRNVSGSDVA